MAVDYRLGGGLPALKIGCFVSAVPRMFRRIQGGNWIAVVDKLSQ